MIAYALCSDVKCPGPVRAPASSIYLPGIKKLSNFDKNARMKFVQVSYDYGSKCQNVGIADENL